MDPHMLVECDFCGQTETYSLRRVVALPRPSDPTELCAVMWGCGRCEFSGHLPTATELEAAVEDGRPIDGRKYSFVTV